MDNQSIQNSIVKFTDTEVDISLQSVADAKRALKEAKLKKRSTLSQREIYLNFKS